MKRNDDATDDWRLPIDSNVFEWNAEELTRLRIQPIPSWIEQMPAAVALDLGSECGRRSNHNDKSQHNIPAQIRGHFGDGCCRVYTGGAGQTRTANCSTNAGYLITQSGEVSRSNCFERTTPLLHAGNLVLLLAVDLALRLVGLLFGRC